MKSCLGPLVVLAFIAGMAYLVVHLVEEDTLGVPSVPRPAPVGQVQDIARDYYNTHQYIRDVYDCDDMAKDIWNILYAQGIRARLVIGNLEMEDERLMDCDHMWLLVWSEEGQGWFVVEATNGEVY